MVNCGVYFQKDFKDELFEKEVKQTNFHLFLFLKRWKTQNEDKKTKA